MIGILQILGYYAVCIAIMGTVGNMIIAYVSIKSKKTNSTFVLFRYLALNNTLSLYFWNLNHFIYSSFNLDIQNFNIFSCKIGSWVQFSSLQSSAWILVLISIDRLLIFKINNWKKIYFTQGIAVISGLCLIVLIFLINSNVLITFGYQVESNGTILTQCFATIPSTYWMIIWNNVHSFMYSFIPFLLLVIINIFLIVDLNMKKRMASVPNSVIKKNQLSITFSIILLTILFILFTSPSAVSSQFYNILVTTYTGNIILFASDCLAFSYHALNIIILCLSNKQFLRKLKECLGIKNLDVFPTHKTNHTNNLQS